MKSGPPPSPLSGAHQGQKPAFDWRTQFKPRARLAIVLVEYDVVDGMTGERLALRTWICGPSSEKAVRTWQSADGHAGIEARTSVLVEPKAPRIPQWVPGAQKKVQRADEPRQCGCGKPWHHKGQCVYRRWLGRGMGPHETFVEPAEMKRREGVEATARTFESVPIVQLAAVG